MARAWAGDKALSAWDRDRRSRWAGTASVLASVLIGPFAASVDSDWPGTSATSC